MREIEVVEHRGEPSKLFDVIRDKMTEKSYNPDTTLVCLVLTSGIYDFKVLARKLREVNSSLKHIFVIFGGMALSDAVPTIEQLRANFSMVQLLPVFEQTTFDLKPHLNNFDACYNRGQESRLIENNQVYFGTANPKYNK